LRTNGCAASLALLAVACVDQTPVTPSANRVIVQAVIDAGVNDQIFVVQTTTGAENQQQNVRGARVTVTTPDSRTVTGTEVADTTPSRLAGAAPIVTTRYRVSFAEVGGIVAGGRYLLHIVVPDGREVNGVTTVPDVVPTTRVPALADFDRNRDTLSLAWASARGAAAYEVFIGSPRAAFSLFSDTVVTIPGKAENEDGVAAFFPGLAHRVVISAVDKNYYDYYRRTSDLFSGRGLISHLDGGIGVFGSIVPIASYSLMVR
jgi:hypothetical protein